MNDPNKDLESGGGADPSKRLYPNLDELESPGTMNLTQLTSLLRPVSKSDSHPTGITSAPAITPESQAPPFIIHSNANGYRFGGNVVIPQPTPVIPSSLHLPSNPPPQMTYLTGGSPQHGSGHRGPFSSQPGTFGANNPPLPPAIRLHQARLKTDLKGSSKISPRIPPQARSPHCSTSSCNPIAVSLPTSKLFRYKTHQICRPLGTFHPYKATYGGRQSIRSGQRMVEREVNFQSITSMPKYAIKSFEELRWEDYQLIGNKPPENYAVGCNAVDFEVPVFPQPTYLGPSNGIRTVPTNGSVGVPLFTSRYSWNVPNEESVSADKDQTALKNYGLGRVSNQPPRQPPTPPTVTPVTVHLPRRLTLSFITLNILVFLMVILIAFYIWSQRTNQ